MVPEGAPAAFYLHSPGGDGPPPPIRDSPHIKGDPPAELGGARKDGPKEDDGGKRDGVKGKDPPPPTLPQRGTPQEGSPFKGTSPHCFPTKERPLVVTAPKAQHPLKGQCCIVSPIKRAP